MEEKFNFTTLFLSTIFTLFIYGCSHSQPSTKIIEQDLAATQKPDRETILPPIEIGSLIEPYTNISESEKFIWQRIANKSVLSDYYDHPHVVQKKQEYLANTKYLSIVSQQSEPFIYFILNEIEKRDMPVELAVLPIVESSYSPKARSRARAVGLWQFMAGTANEYGLKRYQDYDMRHDVYASTAAALDYLSELHNLFNEDWLLALAAYNAGPNRVKRALKKHAAQNHDIDDKDLYWEIKLPRETRNYVPKLLALSSIINDRSLSNKLLHPVANEPYLKSIQAPKQIVPAKLARITGVDASELKKLNPALSSLHNPLPSNYHLLVPSQDAELLSITIKSMPEELLPTWLHHRISTGDTLGGIARKYGTSVHALREANDLKNNIIIAGKTLNVPTHQAIKNNTHTNKPSKKIVRAITKKTKISEPYFYVVAAGDSFWEIAYRNNTTVERLTQINDRNPDQPLQPGESLLID